MFGPHAMLLCALCADIAAVMAGYNIATADGQLHVYVRRVAFWRQVTSHQAQPGGCDGLAAVQQQTLQPANPWGPSASLPGSGTLAHQLHQLAWTSILLAREHHQQQEQEQHPVRELVVGAAPMDALRAKLHTYLAAHMRWRQQQAAAPPLAPAEKWVTLEHEEQVGAGAAGTWGGPHPKVLVLRTAVICSDTVWHILRFSFSFSTHCHGSDNALLYSTALFQILPCGILIERLEGQMVAGEWRVWGLGPGQRL